VGKYHCLRAAHILDLDYPAARGHCPACGHPDRPLFAWDRFFVLFVDSSKRIRCVDRANVVPVDVHGTKGRQDTRNDSDGEEKRKSMQKHVEGDPADKRQEQGNCDNRAVATEVELGSAAVSIGRNERSHGYTTLVARLPPG